MNLSARCIALCSFLTLLVIPLHANVRLPSIISDHMVLQSGEPASVWGWADPDEKVTVSILGQSKEATAGPDGKWAVKLDKLAPSPQPTTLTVAGKNTITVNDVVAGEVWVCSGQSNMALRVLGTKDSDKEIPAANHPMIRMFFVRSDGSRTQEDNCMGAWQVCSPETVGLFSATAYYFGKTLNASLNSPVGLINSSVGGTRIEAWTSAAAQKAEPALAERVAQYEKDAAAFNPEAAKAKYEKDLVEWKVRAEQAKAAGQPPLHPLMEPISARLKQGRELGVLFNAKIAPLVPYTIKGAIWYQGEANSSPDRAPLYGKQLAVLIQDWRSRWGYDFPFGVVQLTNFDGGAGRDWPLMRENQLKNLQVKNTGLAITIDIGDKSQIHALNKPEVGRRLALWALGDVYGQKIPSSSGPIPDGNETKGGEIVVKFKHADEGLVAKDGDLKGFLIAGDDRQWKPASAKIEGDTVVISSPEVPKPAAARYAWANFPECNLFNGAGLPASPFRTDDWVDPVVASAPGAAEGGDAESEGPAAPAAKQPAQPKAAAPAPEQVAPSATVAEGNNILKNGDFSEPINTSKKRGVWMLNTAAEKGSASAYNLATNGFAVSGGTLEADLSLLNPAATAKINEVTLSQVINALEPGKHYQFSFEASSSEAGNRIQVGVGVTTSGLGDMAVGLSRQMVDLGTEYKRYAYDFTATAPPAAGPDPMKFTRVDVRFGNAHGKVSFRDFRLVETN